MNLNWKNIPLSSDLSERSVQAFSERLLYRSHGENLTPEQLKKEQDAHCLTQKNGAWVASGIQGEWMVVPYGDESVLIINYGHEMAEVACGGPQGLMILAECIENDENHEDEAKQLKAAGFNPVGGIGGVIPADPIDYQRKISGSRVATITANNGAISLGSRSKNGYTYRSDLTIGYGKKLKGMNSYKTNGEKLSRAVLAGALRIVEAKIKQKDQNGKPYSDFF